MKFLAAILLLASVCIAPNVNAQQGYAAQKATATGERLSDQAYYENSSGGPLALVDSAHYTYGNTRGSRFNYNSLRYVDLTMLGSGPITDFLNIPIPTNNIDSTYFPTVDFDSADVLLNIGSTVPSPLHTTEGHTYTSANAYDVVTNKVYDNLGAQQYGQRTANVYTSGRLTRVYVSNYNAGVYDTSFIRDLAYDVSGRLVLDSVSAKLPAFTAWSRIVYAYGAGPGFITATYSFYKPSLPGLALKSRITNTYYPSGLVKSSNYDTYYTSVASFKPAEADSFGYTSGTLGHTYLRQSILDTAGVRQYVYYTLTSHINANGQKDSVTFLGYQDTVFSGGGSTAITYNSNGNPEEQREYNLNLNLVPSLYAKERYYYEPIPAAAVVNLTAAAVPIVVYPNPTSGTIHLKIPEAYTTNTIAIIVADASGRLVHTATIPAPGREASIVLDDKLTPGQYFITIRDAGGRGLYTGSILKR